MKSVVITRGRHGHQPKPPGTPLYYRLVFEGKLDELEDFFDLHDDNYGFDQEVSGKTAWTEESVLAMIEAFVKRNFSSFIDMLNEYDFVDWDEEVGFSISLKPFDAQEVL